MEGFRRISQGVALLFAVGLVSAACTSAPAATESPTFVSTPSPTPTPWLTLNVGDCTAEIDFSVKPKAESITTVDCDSTHYFEVYGQIAVDRSVYPGESQLASIAAEKCSAEFVNYVGVAANYSRYSSVYLAPDAAGWSNKANREIWCLLGSANRELIGSAKGDFTIFPHKGQCTGPQNVSALELEIIDCDQEHYFEVYATKEIKTKTAPSSNERKRLVDEVCKAEFAKFVGTTPARSKYQYTWFLVDEENWTKIADHRLVCSVGSNKGGIKGTLKGKEK
ncbi:MAG: septum formation family protein [Propionibacteriaceae bacterium]|nr:septum formation family protein [Propionibacteriaceae bacterium]